MLVFHRKEQDDLVRGGVAKPFFVLGWSVPGHYHRVMCVWNRGVAVGSHIWTWGGKEE